MIIIELARSLASAIRRLGSDFVGRLTPSVRAAFVAERPMHLRRNVLYVTSGAEGPAFGFLRCPCGCGETLHLRFFGARHPRWRLSTDRKQIVTLAPSVSRQTGCKSHFVLRKGKIHWC
ncbi:DUF6527 family protein [Bradyrhizobium sp. CCBAU 11445]|uniref:DUF6527 family protein n=1 Tax=Bradyrhizobium sp. CCBAU 11445 TaxID=1630896 RepID=UPI002305E24F|nr:DUF6527 family protein [Bradyrhizobium sp. CCBAU 11445]